MLIIGKGHCGNIAFELEWDGDPPVIPARACSCSFCVKHGGVWTSHPGSTLAATIRNASHVSKYAFPCGERCWAGREWAVRPRRWRAKARNQLPPLKADRGNKGSR